MSHHRCLSASSSGNAACCQPSHPNTRCFLPSREEKKPGAQLRGVRGARPGALREDEGAFAPPALRGCAGERAGKRVRKSPAAIGNAAWMSFWKFSAPGSWAGAQREQAALLPGHPPRQWLGPTGGWEPTGLCAIPPCPRDTQPALPDTGACGAEPQTWATSAPLPPPSSSRTSPLPEPAPRAAFGGERQARPRDANPETPPGDSSRRRHGRQPCWAPSPVGLASRPKEGEKKPF